LVLKEEKTALFAGIFACIINFLNKKALSKNFSHIFVTVLS